MLHESIPSSSLFQIKLIFCNGLARIFEIKFVSFDFYRINIPYGKKLIKQNNVIYVLGTSYSIWLLSFIIAEQFYLLEFLFVTALFNIVVTITQRVKFSAGKKSTDKSVRVPHEFNSITLLRSPF